MKENKLTMKYICVLQQCLKTYKQEIIPRVNYFPQEQMGHTNFCYYLSFFLQNQKLPCFMEDIQTYFAEQKIKYL